VPRGVFYAGRVDHDVHIGQRRVQGAGGQLTEVDDAVAPCRVSSGDEGYVAVGTELRDDSGADIAVPPQHQGSHHTTSFNSVVGARATADLGTCRDEWLVGSPEAPLASLSLRYVASR
jgi:hypothetical protein